MSIDTPPITPQQYEVLHGGGAEAAELAKQRLSRRRFLRRSMLAVFGVSTTASVAGALYMLYPSLTTGFGGIQTVGKKAQFPAAKVDAFTQDVSGVFHLPVARTYLVHLSADTKFLLSGSDLQGLFQSENIVKDSDGSYWVALYQRCVHLGCTYAYRSDCKSFKCPCHGSHYNVDGEYLDGPAPRSADRFQLSFNGDDVVVNTGTIDSTVQHPDASTRLIAAPSVACT